MDANVPKTYEGMQCMMNASVVQVLAGLKAEARKADPNAQHPVFEKALAYASKFPGVIMNPEQAAFAGMVGELEDALASAQLTLKTEDGSDQREGLYPYEAAALANLNPGTPDLARQLVPTLERFTDASILDLLKDMQRSQKSAAFGGAEDRLGVAAGAAAEGGYAYGGMGGGGGGGDGASVAGEGASVVGGEGASEGGNSPSGFDEE